MDNLEETVQQAFIKFPPEKSGGCFVATHWIINELSQVKKKVIKVSYRNGILSHCVGVLPDNRIIDTQVFQLALVLPIPDELQPLLYKGIFTKEEYEKLIHQSI